jgi:hypothetical protein
MSQTLELFRIIRSKARKLRAHNPNADGQAFWQPIKLLLEPYDGVVLRWNSTLETPKYRTFREYVMQLPEYDNQKKMIELHHFLIQCVRIPQYEPPNLRKVMQVALNVGQLLGILDHYNMEKLSSDLKKVVKEFVELQMYMFDTYISVATNTSEFDKLVTPEMLDTVRKY